MLWVLFYVKGVVVLGLGGHTGGRFRVSVMGVMGG